MFANKCFDCDKCMIRNEKEIIKEKNRLWQEKIN